MALINLEGIFVPCYPPLEIGNRFRCKFKIRICVTRGTYKIAKLYFITTVAILLKILAAKYDPTLPIL